MREKENSLLSCSYVSFKIYRSNENKCRGAKFGKQKSTHNRKLIVAIEFVLLVAETLRWTCSRLFRSVARPRFSRGVTKRRQRGRRLSVNDYGNDDDVDEDVPVSRPPHSRAIASLRYARCLCHAQTLPPYRGSESLVENTDRPLCRPSTIRPVTLVPSADSFSNGRCVYSTKVTVVQWKRSRHKIRLMAPAHRTR